MTEIEWHVGIKFNYLKWQEIERHTYEISSLLQLSMRERERGDSNLEIKKIDYGCKYLFENKNSFHTTICLGELNH